MKLYCYNSNCDFEYECTAENPPVLRCPKCKGIAFCSDRKITHGDEIFLKSPKEFSRHDGRTWEDYKFGNYV